jgi:hypothetical protein
VTVFVFVTVSAFLCFEYCQNRMGIVMTGNIRRITKIASKTYVPTLRGMRCDDIYFCSPLGPTICSALTSDISTEVGALCLYVRPRNSLMAVNIQIAARNGHRSYHKIQKRRGIRDRNSLFLTVNSGFLKLCEAVTVSVATKKPGSWKQTLDFKARKPKDLNTYWWNGKIQMRRKQNEKTKKTVVCFTYLEIKNLKVRSFVTIRNLFSKIN